jgi:hypothetical protein
MKTFSFPLLGWLLTIVIIVITYFDVLYIIQAIRHLESNNGKESLMIFLKVLLFLSGLKVLSLILIIKGKRIGLWCFGSVLIFSTFIEITESQERAVVLGVTGFVVFYIFRYMIANTNNYRMVSTSSTQ